MTRKRGGRRGQGGARAIRGTAEQEKGRRKVIKLDVENPEKKRRAGRKAPEDKRRGGGDVLVLRRAWGPGKGFSPAGAARLPLESRRREKLRIAAAGNPKRERLTAFRGKEIKTSARSKGNRWSEVRKRKMGEEKSKERKSGCLTTPLWGRAPSGSRRR